MGVALTVWAQPRWADMVQGWMADLSGASLPPESGSSRPGPTPAQVLTHQLTPAPQRAGSLSAGKDAPDVGAAWPLGARCPRGQMSPREFNRCLYDAVHLSETILEAALDTAIAVIEARTDLMATQRARWKGQLQETHSRFLLFRNMDCQSVAPFEGGRTIGNFEQRSLCLIVTNERRAADLRLRYGEVPATPPASVAAAPAANMGLRPATWLKGTPPPVD